MGQHKDNSVVIVYMGQWKYWKVQHIKSTAEALYLYINHLMQDCSNPNVLSTVLLQYFAKPSIKILLHQIMYHNEDMKQTELLWATFEIISNHHQCSVHMLHLHQT